MKSALILALILVGGSVAQAFPLAKIKSHFEAKTMQAAKSYKVSSEPKCADFNGTWQGLCTYDDGTKEPAYAKVEQQGCYSIKSTDANGNTVTLPGTGISTVTGSQLLASALLDQMSYWSSDLQTFYTKIGIKAVSNIPGLFVADEAARFEVSKLGADMIVTGRLPQANGTAKEFVCKYAPQP